MNQGAYVGRFAPSPTGPLHVGSLVAALASYLEARSRGGKWLLRIEDVDQPRSLPGAADSILRQLAAAGFEWDGAVVWQSHAQRQARYVEGLDVLIRDGWVFPCACTRSEMADSALARDGSRRYPGTCRGGLPAGRKARAWRVRAEPGEIRFQDSVQGACSEDVWRDVGDFVLRRADGLIAYQLAVVLDDADAGVSHVLRGADLLDSTARQIYLQRLLGLPTPHYSHVPVVSNAAGEKLSKQTRAAAFDAQAPVPALHQALNFLGQQAPDELARSSLRELWAWAHANWRLTAVPRQRSVRLTA